MVVVRKTVQIMKTREKRESSFSTLHGILLTLAIGTLFAFVGDSGRPEERVLRDSVVEQKWSRARICPLQT